MRARTATSLPSASADPLARARPGIGGGVIRSPRLIAPFVGGGCWFVVANLLFGGFVLRSLAEKVASVLGCVVIVSMEDYRTAPGVDDGISDVNAVDFDALARNLQVGSGSFSSRPVGIWVGLVQCSRANCFTDGPGSVEKWRGLTFLSIVPLVGLINFGCGECTCFLKQKCPMFSFWLSISSSSL